MKFNKNEWLGRWDNFESYLSSENKSMKQCWAEAEEAVKAIPSPLFRNGAKAFWQRACTTVTEKNPVCLDGWNITEAKCGMHIGWLAMEPMPSRDAVKNGRLLSHLHFQYGDSLDRLLHAGKRINPMWYATMCAADGGELERCNIVRALHRMPKWDKLL